MTQLKDLTPNFRHVRLLLAREKGHSEGDPEEGIDLLVPLAADGRLDPAEWKTHQATCRVRHFRAGADDLIGKLRRKPGGQWYFDYAEGERDDEIGFYRLWYLGHGVAGMRRNIPQFRWHQAGARNLARHGGSG